MALILKNLFSLTLECRSADLNFAGSRYIQACWIDVDTDVKENLTVLVLNDIFLNFRRSAQDDFCDVSSVASSSSSVATEYSGGEHSFIGGRLIFCIGNISIFCFDISYWKYIDILFK